MNPTTYDITGATLVGNILIGVGKTTGGIASPENEWILKQNSTYVLETTNTSTGSSDVNMKLNWYDFIQA